MTAAPVCVVLNGVDLMPQNDGALFWPDRRTLIVADLHLEKGSAYARTGQFLPPYDSRATLAALETALNRQKPDQVICLGDSFHDQDAANRLVSADWQQLARLVASVDWVWIAGNHDPAPPGEIGGTIVEQLTLGPLVFRHEADPFGGPGELSGHFHPKAAIQTRARRLSARCFVEDGKRMILPSYGSYTGGLNVFDPAISNLFPSGFTTHLTLKKGVLSVPRRRLLKAG